jgi:hypothetical protein
MAERLITWRGTTRSLKNWAAHLGIHRATIASRLDRGWPLAKALSSDMFVTGPKPGTRQSPEHVAHRRAVMIKYGQPSRAIREYRAWCNIKTRCFNKSRRQWKDYGGRGITMCPAWQESFPIFLRDMGPCPPAYTIDRINNDGNYEPANCRWSSRQEQRENSRQKIRFVTFSNGTRRPLVDIARQIGIRYKTLARRLDVGWSLDKALDPARVPGGRPKGHRQTPEHIAKRIAATVQTKRARGYEVAR